MFVSDPNSCSNFKEITCDHVHLDLEINFNQNILKGNVELTLLKRDSNVKEIILDVNHLNVESVIHESGQSLPVLKPKKHNSKLFVFF